jgi:Cft2 family RNA processing exonuclease
MADMHIRFHGAAAEDTGSCHLIEVGDHRLLLDCGLIQGGARDEARNREAFPFDPATIADAGLVLMESTYGDRLHRPHEETWVGIRDGSAFKNTK